MSIPLTDLKLQYRSIKEEIDSAIKNVVAEGDYILGKEVSIFEEELAKYIGAKFAIGVASGTDALVLALSACDIKRGNEVITTPFTFIATAEAICRVGAKPVFCDIEEDTYNIDPKKIELKITKNTKAIIPVHLYGLPCNMDDILTIAKSYKLKIIEDCAQAFGAEYRHKKVGVWGDCGCFSFFPAKTLGAFGDGGMVVTNCEEIAQKIKMLRNHGSTNKYYYSLHGFNSRLDTLQAAILRVKLRHIDNWIERRRENALYYNNLLTGKSILTPPYDLFNSNTLYKHTFNYYTIRLDSKRDFIQQYLKDKGIYSAVYYPLSLHLQDVYKDLGYRWGDFPVAEEMQNKVLSLPMFPELTHAQIENIVEVIKEALRDD
ncbi:MAG: DegT/DnrJ/EryC1/StrS family aminotransferase [Candidatus Omnitrophica bacterium]|nr:DegT/DnrJ/EryC1/StrS family aminotransferase [Candidatus Omnitrophota bacterium]MCM8825962.1 DegT/DnrJ/EryC1/StrS family aminotransferase [Candidatus Omnitrophota bacterium]